MVTMGVDELRQTLADHLAQGVGDIVGVDRHDIAVGVGVKVFDGQRLHMGEHFVTQVFQRALGDFAIRRFCTNTAQMPTQ